MNAERWKRVGDLMAAALDVQPEDRAAFLAAACERDGTLRGEVEALLQCHASAAGFLSQPAAVTGPDEPGDLAGRRIGSYRLLREIGRGGMGTVYLAVREDGLHDVPVALKVIRGGRECHEVVSRFENERRILAALRHPGIARLIDGGTTEDGLPYFVMEYVPGQPILAYCDHRGPGLTERLELFRRVCEAVQHAHQILVVHRDLKPANILVDDHAQPKLLDFGIAKLLGAEAPAVTVADRPPFTPAYASPEQVRGEPVTVASDVYSLGVLLFELLAGARPYSVEGLSAAQVERVVCRQDPPRPSAVAVSQRRLPGELDSIVLKALRKDPAERYPTVHELSEDLRRFLAGLPVRARPSSVAYRAVRFVGRHRWGVATAVAFALVGLAAGVNAWRQGLRTERERLRAEQVSAFLVELFQVSDPQAASEPARPRGASITAGELLQRGAAQLSELEDQPEVQAALMNTLGVIHARLGLHERGQALLRESLERRRQLLGSRHLDVAESLVNLADACERKGEHDQALALAEDALAVYREHGAERLPGFARAQHLSAIGVLHRGETDVAESRLRQALAASRRARGGTDGATADILSSLAALLTIRGKYSEAESLLRQAVADHRLRGEMQSLAAAEALEGLARALTREGRISREAEALLREAIGIRRQLHRTPTADLAYELAMLARQLAARGAFDQAEPLALDAVAASRGTGSQRTRDLAFPLAALGLVRHGQGDLKDAEEAYRECLALARAGPPSSDRFLVTPLVGLGSVLTDLGELGAAEGLLRDGLDVARRAFPTGHVRIAEAQSALGGWLAASGRPEEAEPLLTESAATLRAALGDQHAVTRTALKRLAEVQRLRAAR